MLICGNYIRCFSNEYAISRLLVPTTVQTIVSKAYVKGGLIFCLLFFLGSV